MNEQKLAALADELEEQARGIRNTIALWNARSGARALNGFSATLNGARKLRGDNSNGNGRKRGRRSTEDLIADTRAALSDGPQTAGEIAKRMGYSSSSSVYAMLQRLRGTKLITEGEMSADGQTYVLADGAVSSNGHKAAKAKVRKPQPATKAKNYHTSDSVRARRVKMAELLSGLSTTEPTQLGKASGVLSRYGYVKKKGDGFVRTGKEFNIEKEH